MGKHGLDGDLWYDFHLGNNAGGAGDGFESDLAMIFPALAHSAGLEPEWISLSSRVAAMKLGALREFDYLPLDNEWGYKFLTPIHVRETWLQEGGWKGEFRGNSWWTVPSVAGGAYGPWYVDTLLRDHVPAFDRMFYDNFEDVRDAIASDDRHWLIVSGYAAEARVHDPFLAAVKLIRRPWHSREERFALAEPARRSHLEFMPVSAGDDGYQRRPRAPIPIHEIRPANRW